MMRSVVSFLSIAFCGFVFAINASAQDDYITAKGERVSALERFKDCDACPEMIVLPLGSFEMGSSVKEANAARMRYFAVRNSDRSAYENDLRQSFLNLGIDPDNPEDGLRAYYASGKIIRKEDPQYYVNPFLHEVPSHTVLIDMPIAMGRNEVTRAEWAACVKDGGCEVGQKNIPRSQYISCDNSKSCEPTPDSRVRFRLVNGPYATHPRSPKTGITFVEMNEYTSWLNQKIGADVYRVPTEAEWEYAARAMTTTRYAQGDSLSLEQANYLVYSCESVNGELTCDYNLGSARKLLPVDELDAANQWGLRHMSGNASEFTSTCGEGPHRALASSRQYLEADIDRPDCERSVKGGMYSGHVELARPARRVGITIDHWSPSIGFRVVRDLEPAQ